MLEQLYTYDKELLLLINGVHTPILDGIMIYISSIAGWLPLYVFLIYIIYKDYRRNTWLVLAFVALTVILSDQISVHLFKNVFQRLRPCHNANINYLLHMVKYCGGKYGFISSHATNSFGIATFIILLLHKKHIWVLPIMLIYGFLIIYSRVYLGVHFPTDVIAGAIVGTIIGLSTYLLFKYVDKLK